MVSRQLRAPFEERPLAGEAAVAVVAFGAFVLWVQALQRLGYRVTSTLQPDALATTDLGSLTATALTNGTVVVTGMVAFALAYGRLRGRPFELTMPGREDAPAVAAAVLVPVAGVAAVTGLASTAGTSLAVLEGTSYAAETEPTLPVALTLLSLLVGLPAYVIATHGLVQRTVGFAGRPGVAIAATVLLVGTVGPRDLTGVGLPARTATVTLLLGASIALPAVAAHAFDSRWLRRFCAVPLVAFVSGVLLLWVGGLRWPAEGALALTELAVVAVAAYGYEESESLVVPAMAYAAFAVTVDAVAFVVGTGMSP